MFSLPTFFRVTQNFPRPVVKELPSEVRCQLSKLRERVLPGARIAVTAGSRGIRNIALILREVCGVLRSWGASPFLVAAMGSHGGGTESGQREVLASLGITEESVGAEIVATTDVVEVGVTLSGLPVYCDRAAWDSDGILIVNRVKPHTSFRGRIESGLLKMLCVGLGKARGASLLHEAGPAGMSQRVVEMGQVLLASGKVLGGLAIVENAYDETARLVTLAPEEIEPGESSLLQEARDLMPRIPVAEADLLVVKWMGKNFSGTGMDTNVIGRFQLEGLPEPERPRFRRIAVLDISPESEGNATGIGLADFTTRRLVEKIERTSTYLNCLTTGFVHRAKIPMYFDRDTEIFEAAARSLGVGDGGVLRVVCVENTLHLEELWVSEPLLPRLDCEGCQVDPVPVRPTFDAFGRMTAP